MPSLHAANPTAFNFGGSLANDHWRLHSLIPTVVTACGLVRDAAELHEQDSTYLLGQVRRYHQLQRSR